MQGSTHKIILIVSLCLFALVSSCSDSVTDPDRDSVAKESFYYRFQVSEQVLIEVSGVSGSITVTGSAGSDSIVVKGEKRVTSNSPEDALEYLDSLVVEVKNEAGTVSAETGQPVEPDGRQYVVDYEVIIPADLAVSLSNVNGSISIDSVARPITVQAVNGTLLLSEIEASVTASVVNGTIEGDITLPPAGLISMSVVNGEIEIDLPLDTSAMFSASYVSGSIYTFNLPLQDVVTTPGSLAGRLGEGDGTIALSVVNGTITARGF